MPPVIHSLHFVTVLAMLSGMLLVIFGSIGVANEGTTYDMLYVVDGLKNAMGTTFSIMPYIEGVGIYMIILGAVITLIHLKGSAVVLLKRNKILRAFLVMLAAGILAETGLIIYASVWSIYDDYALFQIKPDMYNSLSNDFKGEGIIDGNAYKLSTKEVEKSWEKLQFQTYCCGVNQFSDYQDFKWDNSFEYNSTTYNLTYPVSCCPLNTAFIDNADGTVPISSFVDLTKCLADSSSSVGPPNAYPCSLYMQDFVYQFCLIAIILSSLLIFFKISAVGIVLVGLKNLGPD